MNSLKIIGLAIAISAFFFISDYARFHNNFDRFHENRDRIYRIVTTVISPDLQDITAWSHSYLRDIADELTGVEEVVRLLKVEEAVVVSTGRKEFKEPEVYFTDPEFGQVFSYDWMEGNPATALMNPGSVVLTASTARKYFNNTQDVVGEMITINNESFQVTGLVADIPANSDLKFDFLLPFTQVAMDEWMFVYILLEQGKKVEDLEAGFAQIMSDYNDHYTDQGVELTYDFEKITDVHFSEPKLYDSPKMSKQRINLFLLVGWIILIIALVNYINLYTTQLLQRIRSVNVQMVVGATKKQLFLEFATEAFIYLGLGLLIGIGITFLGKDLLSQYAGFGFFSVSLPWSFTISVILAFLSSILIASVYSLAISTRKSNSQLFETKAIKAPLRKGLIGVQFALSFAMILGTLIIYLQTSYIQNQPLGFNPDQTISFQFPDIKQSKINAIKADLSNLDFVQSVSQIESNAIPGMDAWLEEYYIPELEQTKIFEELGIDDQYDETLELKLISGEFFTKGKHKPYRAFVVNQSFLEHLGWDAQSAIGKKLSVYGYRASIVGVVENFYFNSPHELIQPLILHYTPNGSFAMARLSDQVDLRSAMSRMEMVWFKHLPNLSFNFSFLRSDYATQFKEEQATLNVLGLVACLVISLSLLGMYAILLMLAKTREKELGIRKVNGAQASDLFSLFSREFIKILVISILISSPLVWLGISKWLEKYPLRITLNPIYFMAIAIVITLSACVIMYIQALRSYKSNTVDCLKYE